MLVLVLVRVLATLLPLASSTLTVFSSPPGEAPVVTVTAVGEQEQEQEQWAEEEGRAGHSAGGGGFKDTAAAAAIALAGTETTARPPGGCNCGWPGAGVGCAEVLGMTGPVTP